jgi:DNA sulfur modification protein DndD
LDPKKNVVLIHGRNGFGKTSFINALKLFFVGTSDLEIRTMRGSRQYTQRDYILGAGAEWEGAFNRRALANKEKECSISVTWEEPLGVVSATRSWTIDGPTSVLENLHISADFPVEAGTLDDAEQRQDFIERRLPPTLVPFFIYDAEQVQRIAESNSEAVLEQIERLLDITAINTADTYVGRVLQKLRRDSNARGEQLRLEELRGHYEVARSTKGQTDAEIEMLEAPKLKSCR